MLTVSEVDVYYGGIQALRRVSLQVGEEEIVVLLGANGAGKSTLLMTISGILSARSGRIVFDGTEITRQIPSRTVQMGLCQVPEGRGIIKCLSTLDNLCLGAYSRRRGLSKKEMEADIERVCLTFPILKARRSQSAGTLSGGEQQMLAIARSLMARPRLLMIDEPSLGLGPLIVEEIFRILKRLREENIPLLIIEQNARAALRIATRGYVMETGSITLEGKGEDLLENPRVVLAYLGK